MADTPQTAAKTAMVLAAGLGTRMRPITDRIPKPLVEVDGRTLLDRALDALVAAGVARAVVNVHHLADQIETHLATRDDIETVVSDERALLMDSGGGVARALPHLSDTFFILNADTFWVDGTVPNLLRMADTFGDAEMQLLLAPHARAVGFGGRGDFFMKGDVLERRGQREHAPFIYAGAILARRESFADAAPGPFSLNRVFDRAIAARRLTGTVMDGLWLHVGTPEAIGEAEAALRARRAAA